jgi:hypothetical protein
LPVRLRQFLSAVVGGVNKISGKNDTAGKTRSLARTANPAVTPVSKQKQPHRHSVAAILLASMDA